MDKALSLETAIGEPSISAQVIARYLQPRIDKGSLAISLPGGSVVRLEGNRPGHRARVTLARWKALTRLVTRGGVGFAEGYLAEDWQTDSLSDLLSFIGDNLSGLKSISNGTRLQRLTDLARHALNRNTRHGSQRNISFHYDLGNDFYRTWLDETMSYSAADFSATNDFERAQHDKNARLCRMADVAPGQNVLEIGCGWGGLLAHLADEDCKATGVSVSREQVDFAGNRLRDAKNVDVQLRDYRDVKGKFDRVLSVEMFEAVGEAYWDTFASKLENLLADDGIAAMQVITIDEAAFPAYRKRPDFIQQYIFPGGMLPTVTHLKDIMNRHGLVVTALHRFGGDYGETLARWRERFEAAWPVIESQGFDARFKKLWLYYLCYCEAGFRIGQTDVVQVRIERQ